MSVSSIRVVLRACFRAAISLGLLTVFSIGCSIVSAQALGNNTPGFIKNAKDLGEADLGTMMTATVWLKLHTKICSIS